MVGSGRLDLALAWDNGAAWAHAASVARLPMYWVGSQDFVFPTAGEPLPLVSMEAPCVMRAAAADALDRAGVPWRDAVTSSSLGGVWAAVAAGLGLTVRTKAGLPKHLRILGGLPDLPPIELALYQAEAAPPPQVGCLQAILLEALDEVIGGKL
jgi:DNA-binding transcriptional LysR family regulator